MCKIDLLITLSLSVSLSQLFELVFLLFASVCVRHEIIKLFVLFVCIHAFNAQTAIFQSCRDFFNVLS